MPAAGSAHNWFGIQVTLTTSTAQQLIALLQAIEPTVPQTVKELYIQADSSVTGTLLIGDAKIGASRYGLALTSTSSVAPIQGFGTGSGEQNVPLMAFWVFSTAAMKVNVFAFC